jgi:hypothetical protein
MIGSVSVLNAFSLRLLSYLPMPLLKTAVVFTAVFA